LFFRSRADFPLRTLILVQVFLRAFWAVAIRAADKHPFTVGDWEALRHVRSASYRPMARASSIAFLTMETRREKKEWHLIDVSEKTAAAGTPENFDLPDSERRRSLFGFYEVEKKGQLASFFVRRQSHADSRAGPNGMRAAATLPTERDLPYSPISAPLDPLAEVRHVVETMSSAFTPSESTAPTARGGART